jgi:hypothetical protein
MTVGQLHAAYNLEYRLYRAHKSGERFSSGVRTYSKCFHFDLCLVSAKFI